MAQLEGDRDIVVRQRRCARRDRMALEVVVKLDQLGIGGGFALPVQPLQQMAAPFGEVDRARRQRFGMKGEPKHVERRAPAVAPECRRAAAPPCGWPTPDSSAGS